MLKKKTTTLLITVALLTSVMPAAFADTTEQPPQMPTQSQGKQPPAKPDGAQSDGEQPPQMPNGEQPQGDMYQFRSPMLQAMLGIILQYPKHTEKDLFPV